MYLFYETMFLWKTIFFFFRVSGTVKIKPKSFNTFFALKSQISENKCMWAKRNFVSEANIIILVEFDLAYIIPFWNNM